MEQIFGPVVVQCHFIVTVLGVQSRAVSIAFGSQSVLFNFLVKWILLSEHFYHFIIL